MLNLSKNAVWVLCMLVLFALTFYIQALTPLEQKATDQSIEKALESLKQKNITELKNVAVMPIWGDEDHYITEVLKSAITKTNFNLFVRSDKEWDTLLSEMKWETLREDMMDTKTIQKFGKIQGVDGLIYGTVWHINNNLWGTHSEVKFTINLADIETGQVLWSSGPVMGESYISWGDAITRFWKYPFLLLGVIVGLIILLIILVIVKRSIIRSMRPR